MKICTKCGTAKPLCNFYKNKKCADGLECRCAACAKIEKKAYLQTKMGVSSKIYNQQTSSSKVRGHSKPPYSLVDIRKWLFFQPKFHFLYDNWKKSGFKKRLIPSIDRIDDSRGYSFDNIQLMTWGENDDKGHRDAMTEKLRFGAEKKKVVQFSLDGAYIADFISIAEASAKTGNNRANVSACCSGKRKTTGGFKWAFKD